MLFDRRNRKELFMSEEQRELLEDLMLEQQEGA